MENKKEIKSARLVNPIRPQLSTVPREDIIKKIERERARDAEEVVGIFQNIEVKGGTVAFPIKLHHGDEFLNYEFTDGERYRIPRGIARHLNNNCFYYEYKHINGQSGEQGMRAGLVSDGKLKASQAMQVATKVHRFAFRSMEFMDEDLEMYPSNIVTVEHI